MVTRVLARLEGSEVEARTAPEAEVADLTCPFCRRGTVYSGDAAVGRCRVCRGRGRLTGPEYRLLGMRLAAALEKG